MPDVKHFVSERHYITECFMESALGLFPFHRTERAGWVVTNSLRFLLVLLMLSFVIIRQSWEGMRAANFVASAISKKTTKNKS
jgi:hypothetical protein